MEKCKYCNEELPEGSTVCPACGKDNAEAPVVEATEEVVDTAVEETAAPAEETAAPVEAAPAAVEEKPEVKKATPGKIALAVGAVVVLLAVLIALILAGVKGKEAPVTEEAAGETLAETVEATIPADGNPDDATCKGTYTVTDEEVLAAKDTVVATIGDAQLTNGLLQVHYWSAVNSFLNSQQGYYVRMYGGIDPAQALDTQRCTVDDTVTWQQHFLRQALSNWQTSLALSTEAEKAGVEMSQEAQEFLAGMEEYLEQTAASYGMTVDELMLRNVGPGAGLEEFIAFQQLFSEGREYYAGEVSKMVPTEEDLADFFAEHEAEYAEGGITKDGKFANVRHILVMPKAGEGAETAEFTEEQWKACEADAQAILDGWMAGEKTEESFAALANEKSEDPGSNTNGGLYENIFKGQMVKPFEDWCFDETRKAGDTGLVKTDYGYHIMYFVSTTDQWRTYAESDWLTDQTNKFIESLAESYPMEADYSKMMLGYLDMAQ